MATIPGAMINQAGDDIDTSAQKMEGLLDAADATQTEEVDDTTSVKAEQTTEEEVTQTQEETQEEDTTEVEATSEDADQTETDTETQDEDAIELEPAVLARFLGVDESALTVSDDGDLMVNTKIDGESGQVKMDDIIKSYQLQGHVNKKSEELANSKKEFETKRDEMFQEYGQKINEAAGFVSALEQAFLAKYQGVDWNTLRTENPAEFAALQTEANQQQAKINALKEATAQQMTQYQEEAKTQATERFAQTRAKEAEALMQALPEWSDETVMQQETSELRGYLSGTGFSDDEIDGIVDHRAVVIARKAMKYDQLQKAGKTAKEKKVAKKLKVVKSNAGKTPKQRKAEVNQAKIEKLKKSGHVEDAADLFIDLL